MIGFSNIIDIYPGLVNSCFGQRAADRFSIALIILSLPISPFYFMSLNCCTRNFDVYGSDLFKLIDFEQLLNQLWFSLIDNFFILFYLSSYVILHYAWHSPGLLYSAVVFPV